jgi:hypothetical protein
VRFPARSSYRQLLDHRFSRGALGNLANPGGSAILTGIAVAPPGLGEGFVAIPALSGFGLALFTLALCAVAVRLSLRRRVAALS